IQFNRDTTGELHPLPQRHVDTGMGFERICRILQGVTSNYDTDVFQPLIRKISELSGQEYTGTEDGRTDVATRVVADHARALTFAIADGAAPSNSGRGYVLRRLVSRASEFSSSALNVRGPILWKLVDVIA